MLGLFAPTSYAQQPHSIVVGATYNIFHEEYSTDQEFFDRVDKDIALMKESNITHVMIFPMSQWDPGTKQLRWTRTDYLVKKIGDAHMKFVPLMLKEEQCGYYFPIWKFKEIPGMWDEYNLKNGNENNRENVDFADPRVYPLLEEYFKAVIERYGKNPALSFYNIWNEPHYNSDADHVIDQFRDWLKKKYGALPALRRAWGKEYTAWDQVSPFLSDNWNSSMPQIDWIMFRNELNGILLARLDSTLRKYDAVHPVNANPVGTPWANFNSFGSYNIDNWVIADHDDIHGISYYPDGWERQNNLTPCPFWLHNLTFNTVRCASGNKNYILTEVYTNAQNGLALNGYLTYDFVKDLAWTALSNDCKGMIYWKWSPFMRGRQSLGRGLTRVDGELADRGKAVKDLGAMMKRYGEMLFRAHLRKPQVAVLVDMVGLVKTLEQTTEPATNKFMYESNAGLFKALYEKNISEDILRMDRPLTLQQLESYKIIFLPFQIVMRRHVAELLREYVRNGGWLVADARTATLDEQDFAYRTSPGAGMDTLFGAVRPDWTGKKGFFTVRTNPIQGDSSIGFEGKYFRDQLNVSPHAEVIGSFEDSGGPAVIQNHFGKGWAILSAVPLGASYYGNPENPVNRIIENFTERAGVVPDARFIAHTGRFLDVKVHTLNDTIIVYAINSDSGRTSGTIEVRLADQKITNVKDILSDRSIPFTQKDHSLIVPVTMARHEVMVLVVSP
jgi:beta-galactosidase GanA